MGWGKKLKLTNKKQDEEFFWYGSKKIIYICIKMPAV
jgi:hypothetical protein